MTMTTKDVKTMKQDIDQIKNILADQLEESLANGASKTVLTKEDLQHMANQAGKGMREFFSDKQKQLGEAKTVCENTIKERPFTSTAAAFAGGILLTSLLKRK